jgi:hypothetical protein
LALLDVGTSSAVRASRRRWLARYRETIARSIRPATAPVQRLFEYYLACVLAAGRTSDRAVCQVLFTNDGLPKAVETRMTGNGCVLAGAEAFEITRQMTRLGLN